MQLDMHQPTSECVRHFGFEDFEIDFEAVLRNGQCPIKGCMRDLAKAEYRKGSLPFCPVHGLRFHANTFVYWNGMMLRDEARRRNFPVRPDLALTAAIRSTSKAENYRLGYEMSEDALSWNVFVGLADAKKLRAATEYLIDRPVATESDLYLWGERIDIHSESGTPWPYAPLTAVRCRLEKKIRRFRTEPDIMLVVDGQLIVCIEAKFGSGNTLAYDSEPPVGEKPTALAALLGQYLASASIETRRVVLRDAIDIEKPFHSQLFRNIVFASEMAAGADWHVVNLVSSTQRGKESDRCSFANPESPVRTYLHPEHRNRFTYRTWEDLYRVTIEGDSELISLGRYMREKSAHFRRAFQFESGLQERLEPG